MPDDHSLLADMRPVDRRRFLARTTIAGMATIASPAIAAAAVSGESPDLALSSEQSPSRLAPLEHDESTVAHSGAAADARFFINVRDFGAVGDGSTDDTSAIQAAIVAASTARIHAVLVPAGTYLISDTLTFAETITFRGQGLSTVLRVASAVGATTDILKIAPATAAGDRNCGFVFENFRVTPESGRPGRHAIAIDITKRAVYASRFSGLRLDALGGRGVALLPNARPLIDGFFSTVIERCTIYNGIYLDKAGDSLIVRENVILGSNVGVYVDLVSAVPMSSVAGGSHGLDIVDNNITSNGGSLRVINAWQGCFQGNNCEMPTAAGVANNALVDIDGTPGAGNATSGFLVARNFLAAPASYDVVRVNHSRHAQIVHNYIAEPGGGGYNFRITANATDTGIYFNVSSADTAISAQLADAGKRTCVLQNGLAGHVELTGPLALAAAFGCNGRPPQTARSLGKALPEFASGGHGLATEADMLALVAKVAAMDAALKANGIGTI